MIGLRLDYQRSFGAVRWEQLQGEAQPGWPFSLNQVQPAEVPFLRTPFFPVAIERENPDGAPGRPRICRTQPFIFNTQFVGEELPQCASALLGGRARTRARRGPSKRRSC